MPQCTPGAQRPGGRRGDVGRHGLARLHDRPPRHGDRLHRGRHQLARRAAELADKVFLNAGELPPPTTPGRRRRRSTPATTPTPPDANGNGLVDPEDIIVRFSDGIDEDHNGYTDDISGWDFYNDQNDPATLDSTYDHANDQMMQAAAQTNNGDRRGRRSAPSA